MSTARDFLESEADTIGPTLLAKLVYAARHGGEGSADDLAPVMRWLPVEAGRAIPTGRARELGAAYCLEQAAEQYDPSEWLKAARKVAGWSQETLADELETERVSVARWETGGRTPGDESRAKLQGLADDLK